MIFWFHLDFILSFLLFSVGYPWICVSLFGGLVCCGFCCLVFIFIVYEMFSLVVWLVGLFVGGASCSTSLSCVLMVVFWIVLV